MTGRFIPIDKFKRRCNKEIRKTLSPDASDIIQYASGIIQILKSGMFLCKGELFENLSDAEKKLKDN